MHAVQNAAKVFKCTNRWFCLVISFIYASVGKGGHNNERAMLRASFNSATTPSAMACRKFKIPTSIRTEWMLLEYSKYCRNDIVMYRKISNTKDIVQNFNPDKMLFAKSILRF